MSFFNDTHTSDVNKHYHDLGELHYFAGHQIPLIVKCVLSMLCTSVYMLYEDVSIGTIVVSLILCQAVIEKVMDKAVYEQYLQLKKIEKKANRCREESLANVRTVKHFSCESKQCAAFGQLLEKDKAVRTKLVSLWASRCGTGNLLMGLVVCAVWIFGLPRVSEGNMTVGELSSFALLVSHVREAAVRLLSTYQETMKKAPNLKLAFRLMDKRSSMSHGPPSINVQLPFASTSTAHKPCGRVVQLRDVHFSYPTRPGHMSCKGVNLTLRPGTCTALCGPSGGGKSTIVSLIMREYDPNQGAVLVDGQDMRDMDVHSLHEQIAIVSQEPALFSCSIRENIKFGVHHDVTDEEVHVASRLANAHDFICSFDKGYDTEVGERGVQLSGGQKQRLAIARAILKNPAILILDEATSALDAESEFAVQSALDRVMVGRTTLVIAHRLSTIKNADNIAVIQEGCVVEEGNCENLLALDGVYAALVKRQLSAQGVEA